MYMYGVQLGMITRLLLQGLANSKYTLHKSEPNLNLN